MTEREPERDAEEIATRATRDSVTRGFLFTDLRGYTSFVERRGAAAAAELLGRYRDLVRREIGHFNGAEIRTEGDSFYVVFGSVGAAVRCGLEVVSSAAAAADGQPIDVGIGIHAGETVETPEGYVGSPVNIAARLCALARPREVLVTDTVRALTQTLLPVRFVPRGRRRLKGIAEPVAVFAVVTADERATVWGGSRAGRWTGRRRLAVGLGTLAVLALGAVAWAAMRPAALPPGPWTIGVSNTLSGPLMAEFASLHQAIQLAVNEANETGIGGTTLELDIRDDGGDNEFGLDEVRATENARAFAADSRVVAMIGSMHSGPAFLQVPITNEAGLLQCGPSTTDPGLTKPEAGALQVRSAYPERINYVRLAAPADVEGRAAAFYAVEELGAESALVVDDTNDIGRSVADAFQGEFAALGGSVDRRALNPGSDPAAVLEPLAADPNRRWLVYFGGFTDTGAPQLRRAMVDTGYGDHPFLTWDGVYSGSGAEEDTYIALAGDAAAGSYLTRPTLGTVGVGFAQRYREAYGTVPQGPLAEYTGASYACVEIIVAALRELAEARPGAEGLREALRAYVADPEHRFETAIGRIGFDANGDSTQQIVTLYRVDPAAADGAGDWVILEQQNFGGQP